MTLKGKRILITGGTGFLGKAVVKTFLNRCDKSNTIIGIGSKSADLRNYVEVEKITHGVDVVIHLAATAGGIGFNRKYPGKLFYDNMAMGINILEACRRNNIKKTVFISTICAYPKFTKVPFKESDLFSGYPEETNAPYGIAKRSLLVMSQAYRKQYGQNIIYLMPVNLYGPEDGGFFDDERSHVIPALIKKIINAKENNCDKVELWGTGTPTREFLFVDDAAEAIFLATRTYDKPEPVNIGAGFEISIADLVKKVCEIVNYGGLILYDSNMPDGQPRRLLDTSKAEKYFNFKAQIDFNSGLKSTINWYLENRNETD